jgi:hypothetical protein
MRMLLVPTVWRHCNRLRMGPFGIACLVWFGLATAESRAGSSSAEGTSASAPNAASVDAWRWRTDAQVNYVVASVVSSCGAACATRLSVACHAMQVCRVVSKLLTDLHWQASTYSSHLLGAQDRASEKSVIEFRRNQGGRAHCPNRICCSSKLGDEAFRSNRRSSCFDADRSVATIAE